MKALKITLLSILFFFFAASEASAQAGLPSAPTGCRYLEYTTLSDCGADVNFKFTCGTVNGTPSQSGAVTITPVYRVCCYSARACLTAQGVLCENGINSAIGCIPIGNTTDTTTFFLRIGIGIAGGIAILLIIYSGYVISSSSGDPRRLQGGQELLTSAVAGVIMLIFSVFLLRIIGVNILGIL